jgi:hypothetical protein
MKNIYNEECDFLLQGALSVLRTIEQNDELYTLAASMVRKSYEALIKAGFTKDQAIKIMAGHGSIVQIPPRQ